MFHKKKENPEQSGTEFVEGLQQKQERKKEKRKEGKVLLFCCVGMALVYVVLVMVNTSLQNDYKNYQVSAYVPSDSMEKIPANTEVTKENVDSLFAQVIRDKRTLPLDYVTDLTELVGSFTTKDIEQMEVISNSSFYEVNLIDGIKNPVEVSFSVESYDQAVGGTLRRGDCISLFVVKKDEVAPEEVLIAEPIVEETFVTRAFSSAGVEIRREDMENKDTPTTVINIFIPREQEQAFNKSIMEGTLRVSRIAE